MPTFPDRALLIEPFKVSPRKDGRLASSGGPLRPTQRAVVFGKPYAIAFLKFSDALSQLTVFHQALR